MRSFFLDGNPTYKYRRGGGGGGGAEKAVIKTLG